MTPFDYNTATPDEIRAEADRRARARGAWKSGDVQELSPAMQRRKEMLLEKEVQSRVIRLYARYGCRVFNTSQPRRAKFLTPGQADLLVYSPIIKIMSASEAQIEHEIERPTRRVMWFHETKRPKGGRYSDEQLAFAVLCREAGIEIIGGGVEEAQKHLDRLGIEPL